MGESQICLSWALCLWEINHTASVTLWEHGYICEIQGERLEFWKIGK